MACALLGNSDHKIAAGHNSAGSLATLEGTLPAGDKFAFQPVSGGFPDFDPGILRIKPDATYYYAGYPSTAWRLSFVTVLQEKYLRDTYCSGDYSGLVTLRTDIATPGTFANYNATMKLLKRPDLTFNGAVFSNYVISYIHLVAL